MFDKDNRPLDNMSEGLREEVLILYMVSEIILGERGV